MSPAKKKAAKKGGKKSAKKPASKTATKKAAKKASKKPVSAAKKKAAKAKTTAKHEAKLHKAGLVDSATMSDESRKKLAKLKPEEVKALVSAKKKMGFSGTLHGSGADFF